MFLVTSGFGETHGEIGVVTAGYFALAPVAAAATQREVGPGIKTGLPSSGGTAKATPVGPGIKKRNW